MKDAISFPSQGVPQELVSHFSVTKDKSKLVYLPLLHMDPQLQPTYYWVELPEIPTDKLNFTVEVIPLSIGKFRLRCMLAEAAELLKARGLFYLSGYMGVYIFSRY